MAGSAWQAWLFSFLASQCQWLRPHPFVAEREKPPREKGTYLAPAEHGQPEAKGIDCALHPELVRRLQAEREKAAAPRK